MHSTLLRVLVSCPALLVATGCVSRSHASSKPPVSGLTHESAARIVYVGEKHDEPSHHQLQEKIIRWLHRQSTPFAVGMEMIDLTQQGALDAYLGKQISWRDFAQRTAFDRGWGKTSPAYKRILSWCRQNGIRVIGLNAPEIVARKLAHNETLTAEEKRLIPRYPEPPGGLAQFRQAMKSHNTPANAIRRYYVAQQAWDQTMASRILAWVSKQPGTLVVILGRFHADPRTGVPWYVARKTRVKQVILLPQEERNQTHSRKPLSRPRHRSDFQTGRFPAHQS
jgi:uncharacterized iron-regulated protein